MSSFIKQIFEIRNSFTSSRFNKSADGIIIYFSNDVL